MIAELHDATCIRASAHQIETKQNRRILVMSCVSLSQLKRANDDDNDIDIVIAAADAVPIERWARWEIGKRN